MTDLNGKKPWNLRLALAFAVLSLLLHACGVGAPGMGRLEPAGTGPEAVEGGIRFSLLDAKAAKVTIAGDFNNWSATADPLFDREGKGLWTLVLPLSPGSYQYKFIIDGEKWIPDPANPKRVNDGFDGLNSVVDVAPKPPGRAPN